VNSGRGFGKTILIGDQFVLWEVPAILSAITFETECVVERLEDQRIEVPGYKKAKADDCSASFDRMAHVMGLNLDKNPIKIIVKADLLAGSGVGASAAIYVSFARTCNREFNLKMNILDINHVAWEGEFPYHGLPSGLDNTVSTFGGVIKYRIKDGVKQFERNRSNYE
jgi:mevalonate kinase